MNDIQKCADVRRRPKQTWFEQDRPQNPKGDGLQELCLRKADNLRNQGGIVSDKSIVLE